MACTASSAHPPSSFFEPTIAHHTLDEPVAKYIKDPTTSRRIYESDALHIVYQMASKLDIGGNRDRTPDPMFVFEVAKLNGSLVYSCELSMSSSSNSQCFKGTPCHSTSSARRAACFQLCDSLFQRGNLDYRLFPSIDQTRQPFSSIASVVDATHNGSSRIDRLYRRKHSEFWSNCLTSPQGKLYVTIITISMEATSSFHSLLLLTRCALPPISPINFHFLGALGEARMRQIGFLEITTALEETLRAYTQRLLRLVTNKVIEDKGQGVDYLLAPAHKTGGSQINAISSKLPVEGQGCPIDWESVHNHASTPNVAVPLCGERGSNVNLHAIIHDCMVQDRPTEFTRRYEVRRVCTTLSVNSVIPENAGVSDSYDVARHELTPLKGNGSFTFLDELKARANFSGVRDSNQPMLETRRFQPPFNHLSPTTKEYEGGETKCNALWLQTPGRLTASSRFRP
jgi:endoribonuclease Dicer